MLKFSVSTSDTSSAALPAPYSTLTTHRGCGTLAARLVTGADDWTVATTACRSPSKPNKNGKPDVEGTSKSPSSTDPSGANTPIRTPVNPTRGPTSGREKAPSTA